MIIILISIILIVIPVFFLSAIFGFILVLLHGVFQKIFAFFIPIIMTYIVIYYFGWLERKNLLWKLISMVAQKILMSW